MLHLFGLVSQIIQPRSNHSGFGWRSHLQKQMGSFSKGGKPHLLSRKAKHIGPGKHNRPVCSAPPISAMRLSHFYGWHPFMVFSRGNPQLSIWRFPEMGVPLNYPFLHGIFLNKNQPFWGTPNLGTPLSGWKIHGFSHAGDISQVPIHASDHVRSQVKGVSRAVGWDWRPGHHGLRVLDAVYCWDHLINWTKHPSSPQIMAINQHGRFSHGNLWLAEDSLGKLFFDIRIPAIPVAHVGGTPSVTCAELMPPVLPLCWLAKDGLTIIKCIVIIPIHWIVCHHVILKQHGTINQPSFMKYIHSYVHMLMVKHPMKCLQSSINRAHSHNFSPYHHTVKTRVSV